MGTFFAYVIMVAGCYTITDKVLVPVAKGVIAGVKEGVEDLRKKKNETVSSEKAAAE